MQRTDEKKLLHCPRFSLKPSAKSAGTRQRKEVAFHIVVLSNGNPFCLVLLSSLFKLDTENFSLSLQCIMSKNDQTHFKNLAANAARFLKCV